jgi:hypothetical protein
MPGPISSLTVIHSITKDSFQNTGIFSTGIYYLDFLPAIWLKDNFFSSKELTTAGKYEKKNFKCSHRRIEIL